MRRYVLIAAVLAVVVVAAYVIFGILLPGTTQPLTTGTPVITSQFGDIKTKEKTAAPTSTTGAFNTGDYGVRLVAYAPQADSGLVPFQIEITPCNAVSGATATPPGDSAQPTAAATLMATAAATAAANVEPDFIVMQIVSEESEACYQVGELFLDQRNRFNLAIGITKAIAGEIAIDRANLANSRVGEIAIDISQLRSDSGTRDGRIRRDWLESNKFPLAKLTESRVVGLPARAYEDGEVLNFQVVGLLQIRDVQKEVVWNVTASLTGDTLTGSASADILMTDFGFEPPEILGTLRANNEAHLILNFVAREPGTQAAATTSP